MFVAVEAVDYVRQVKLQIQRAFRRRHHSQLFRSLHHVLPLLAVAHHVALDIMRAVIFLVPRQHTLHFFNRLKIVVLENAGPG